MIRILKKPLSYVLTFILVSGWKLISQAQSILDGYCPGNPGLVMTASGPSTIPPHRSVLYEILNLATVVGGNNDGIKSEGPILA